jgi:hypothetical protein
VVCRTKLSYGLYSLRYVTQQPHRLSTDPAELTCARVTRRLWTNPSVINCFRCKLVARIGGKTDAISLIVKAGVNDSHPEGDNINAPEFKSEA